MSWGVRCADTVTRLRAGSLRAALLGQTRPWEPGLDASCLQTTTFNHPGCYACHASCQLAFVYVVWHSRLISS